MVVFSVCMIRLFLTFGRSSFEIVTGGLKP